MSVVVELKLPASLEQFSLPPGVKRRLQQLLDRQDDGQPLTADERKEAEGLVEMAELLALLKLRAHRVRRERPAAR